MGDQVENLMSHIRFQQRHSSENVVKDMTTTMSTRPQLEFSESWHRSRRDSMKTVTVIMVIDRLPIKWTYDQDANTYEAAWLNETVSELQDQLEKETRHIDGSEISYHYIGRPNFLVPDEHQGQVRDILREMNCTPIFVPETTWQYYYKGYCKRVLWPVLHSIVDIYTTARVVLEESEETPDNYWTPSIQEKCWQAYCSANRQFAEAVMTHYTDGDIVWIHDYHLLLVPSFIARKVPTMNMGIFLHTPFPASSVFRTLSMRQELLRGMLNADYIGFHLFAYARNFMSCCQRILGLDYQSTIGGQLGIDYYGRRVSVTCSHPSVNPKRVERLFSLPDVREKVIEYRKRFGNKIIIAGCDSIERLKGIPVKMIAFHQLLINQPQWIGKVILVQIGLHAGARDLDYVNSRDEIRELANYVNAKFKEQAGGPLVYFEETDTICATERVALWKVSDIYVNTSLKEGFSNFAFEYLIAHRQPPGVLIASEFATVSRVLNGGIRVNPWQVDNVVDAFSQALNLSPAEKEARRDRDYKYILHNTPDKWGMRILTDIRNARKKEDKYIYMGTGFGLDFRVLELGHNFRKLEPERLAASYRAANRRAIVFDYYGTIVPMRKPNSGEDWPDVPPRILAALEHLCKDPRNMVFVISGMGRDLLEAKFGTVPMLGLAAEHGYYLKLPRKGSSARLDRPWELADTSIDATYNSSWKELVEGLMHEYVERTAGSELEVKESAVLFRFEGTDVEYGLVQGKDLAYHLRSILEHWPLQVISGKKYVEVRPNNVGALHFLKKLTNEIERNFGEGPDFILTVGDDKGDEEMFEFVETHVQNELLAARSVEAFTVTVGRKPSKARYFVDSTDEVNVLLCTLDTCALKQNRNYSVNDLQDMAAKLALPNLPIPHLRFGGKRSGQLYGNALNGLEPVIEESADAEDRQSGKGSPSRRASRASLDEGYLLDDEDGGWLSFTSVFSGRTLAVIGAVTAAYLAYRTFTAKPKKPSFAALPRS